MSNLLGDNFSYHDSIDGSVSHNQGLRIAFECGSRIVYRLSGTGTSGATIRIYIERFEANKAQHHLEAQTALADLIALARQFSNIQALTGRAETSAIT